jgi:deoxyribodipyrimidine photo-lyase
MGETQSVSVVIFTRDLRVRDHAALQRGLKESERVFPVFVLDDQILATSHGSPNRISFLLESLHDLRSSLQSRGGDLIVRRGDFLEQIDLLVKETGAGTAHLSEDVSAFSARRTEALRGVLAKRDCSLELHPGITVLPPGSNSPGTGGFWKVFTPYYNKWIDAPWRELLPAPQEVNAISGISPGEIPTLAELCSAETSPNLPVGGETAGLERLKNWAASSLEVYEENHNALAADETSRISAYLHFGCLSPLEVATRLQGRPGAAPFIRQLCWRDFYHQVLAARPETANSDYRERGDVWRVDEDDAEAWRQGRTGYPLVDAAMNQLRLEGFMHNRARMVVASFLTKDLYLDWRIGADHFMEFLVDGDVANNQLNWQWTAGTGTDSNPNRIFNPTVQSERFDPDGSYIRRYLPVLSELSAPQIHNPDSTTRERLGYPPHMIDHKEAIVFYKEQLAAHRASLNGDT